jgi:fermentation-respiration switch protein FrsA (DUF1100 family)
LVWLEDVHYNANKFGDQANHTFVWDNLGFDGPKTYRDLTFDVPDRSVSSLGYNLDAGQSGSISPSQQVSWSKSPTGAYVVFNWFPTDTGAIPQVAVNGGAFQSQPFPGSDAYGWRTIAIPVPVTDVHQGTNTISFKRAASSPGNMVISNINLVLVNAAAVP